MRRTITALVTLTFVFAGCVGTTAPSQEPDEDPYVGGHYIYTQWNNTTPFDVWSVGYGPVVVPVGTVSGSFSFENAENETTGWNATRLWYNWTVRGINGDVRLVTYPPGCEPTRRSGEPDCAIVDETNGSPVRHSFHKPEPGWWNWTAESTTPTHDPDRVDGIRDWELVTRKWAPKIPQEEWQEDGNGTRHRNVMG